MNMQNDLSKLSPEARSALDRKPAFFIDGSWHTATEELPVLDPSSALQVASIGRGGAVEIDAAVQAAQRALVSPAWKGIGPMGRERLMRRLADLIDSNLACIAQVETVDNGMPLWMAQGINVPGAADVYRYFSGWPSKINGQTMEVSGPPDGGRYFAYTHREPVGVVGAIVPWNVPFMMAAWKLGPALAAGCTIVLKPAEDASLSALLLADLVSEAGFPPGVVNIVTGLGAEAGEALVRHPGVAKISFTGSTAVGRRIGAICGEQLKKVTLELGGKSPTIIFADAQLDQAVVGAANSIYFNSGQVCVAGSRLYVQDSAYDEVLERLALHVRDIKVGAGLAEGSFMGPLINSRQRGTVQGFIDSARSSGCEVLGERDFSGDSGFYVAPVFVTGAAASDPITQHEIFGPVLSVYKFSNEQEAIDMANDNQYGLAATVWTGNVDRVMRVSSALQAGKVSVNNAGFPYPALPEGGYKSSGTGRDLGQESVEQSLQTKSIMMRSAL